MSLDTVAFEIPLGTNAEVVIPFIILVGKTLGCTVLGVLFSTGSVLVLTPFK